MKKKQIKKAKIGGIMLALQEIEKEVLTLPKKDYSDFREWFYNHDSTKWDEEIKQDIENDSLDFLGQEALVSFNLNLCNKI